VRRCLVERDARLETAEHPCGPPVVVRLQLAGSKMSLVTLVLSQPAAEIPFGVTAAVWIIGERILSLRDLRSGAWKSRQDAGSYLSVTGGIVGGFAAGLVLALHQTLGLPDPVLWVEHVRARVGHADGRRVLDASCQPTSHDVEGSPRCQRRQWASLPKPDGSTLPRARNRMIEGPRMQVGSGHVPAATLYGRLEGMPLSRLPVSTNVARYVCDRDQQRWRRCVGSNPLAPTNPTHPAKRGRDRVLQALQQVE
jgi:hypothetical protein